MRLSATGCLAILGRQKYISWRLIFKSKESKPLDPPARFFMYTFSPLHAPARISRLLLNAPGFAFQYLAKLYLDLLLLRQGPQQLPVSRSWLRLLLVFYALSNVAVLWQVAPLLAATLLGLFDLLLVATVTAGLLWAKGLFNRYQQTLSAVTGCGTVFNVLSVPLVYGGGLETMAPEQAEVLAAPILLLSIAFSCWSFAVSVHIIRHALSLSVGRSILLNIGLFTLYYQLGQTGLRLLS